MLGQKKLSPASLRVTIDLIINNFYMKNSFLTNITGSKGEIKKIKTAFSYQKIQVP